MYSSLSREAGACLCVCVIIVTFLAHGKRRFRTDSVECVVLHLQQQLFRLETYAGPFDYGRSIGASRRVIL